MTKQATIIQCKLASTPELITLMGNEELTKTFSLLQDAEDFMTEQSTLYGFDSFEFQENYGFEASAAIRNIMRSKNVELKEAALQWAKRKVPGIATDTAAGFGDEESLQEWTDWIEDIQKAPNEKLMCLQCGKISKNKKFNLGYAGGGYLNRECPKCGECPIYFQSIAPSQLRKLKKYQCRTKTCTRYKAVAYQPDVQTTTFAPTCTKCNQKMRLYTGSKQPTYIVFNAFENEPDIMVKYELV